MQRLVTVICCTLLACLVLGAGAAYGKTDCTVNAFVLNFGTYDPFAAGHLDIATTATITCSTNKGGGEPVSFTSSIDKGGGPSFGQRQMRNALNNPLDYNLYTTTQRTVIFGDGTSGTSTASGGGYILDKFTPLVIRMDIYGRVFAGQDAGVGAYSDTLIFTITF